MAKTYETNSCGYLLKFEGPDTVEEYDKKAGDGQCLEDAVNNTIYRGTLPEWQDLFSRTLQDRTGVAREIDKTATEKVKSRSKNPENVRDVPERFKTYNARIKSTWANGDKDKEAQLASWAQETADKVKVDPSPTQRVSAAAKGDLAKADDILEHDNNYIEVKIQKMLGVVPDYQLERDDDGKPERQSLARLIGRWVEGMLAA